MSTWEIVAVVLGCLIAVGIIVGLCVYFLVIKKKKQNKNVAQDTTKPTEEQPKEEPKQPEIIQLTAVKLLEGKSVFGFETQEELEARLSSLTKEEFMALEVVDFPFDTDDWDAIAGDSHKIETRNKYEMGMWFACDADKILIEEKASVIRREF